MELRPGQRLRFAASSRTYTLALPPASGDTSGGEPSSAAGRPAKKARVSFRGGCDDAGSLEQVIGYSDGRDFAARVGPQKAGAADGGMFASLVTSTVIKAGLGGNAASGVSSSTGSARRGGSPPPPGGLRDCGDELEDAAAEQSSTGGDAQGHGHAAGHAAGEAGEADGGGGPGPDQAAGSSSGGSGSGSGVKPQLAALMEQLRKPPAKVSLYGDMPPPSMLPPSRKPS